MPYTRHGILSGLCALLIAFVPACSAAINASSLPPPPIIFGRNHKIYIRYPDGRLRWITDGYDAIWAPDHKMLIVQRVVWTNPPSAELWLVPLNGKPPKQLTSVYPDQVRFFAAGVRDHQPFVVYDTDKPGIQIINLNGSGKRTISLAGYVDTLSVSGDGSKIAFTVEDNGNHIPAGLYVVNSNGKGKPRLLVANTPYRQIAGPTFSPNRQSITIVITIARGSAEPLTYATWLINTDGKMLHKLIAGDMPMPTWWSPDGSWLAYLGKLQGEWVVFRMHPNGAGRGELVHLGRNYDPSSMWLDVW